MFALEESDAGSVFIVYPKTKVLARVEKAKLLLISHLNGEGLRQRPQQKEPTYQNEQLDTRLPAVVKNQNKLHNASPGEEGAFL